MIVLRLHQERITRDKNHPEGAGESTVKMKSNFFSVNHLYSVVGLIWSHTRTSFRFMSVFRKYPTSTNFIYIGVSLGNVLHCKSNLGMQEHG